MWAQSSSSADLEGLVTETNVTGRYRVPALPAGEYFVRVAKTGFATVERSGLILQVGAVATVNIDLPVAAQSQKVDVVEAAPIVDAGRSTVGAVVDRGEIENLPINGRSFLDFSRTVAGVTAQQTGGQGSGLSFNGHQVRDDGALESGWPNEFPFVSG
jgi:Carboxypeptidase regulatory-like domain